MIKAKITAQGRAKQKRIDTLPEFGEKVVFGAVKREIDEFIETYKKGLENNDFGLQVLHPKSIKKKQEQGFQKPYSPLYGAGKQEKNSLYNALYIRKVKAGYRILIRTAKHWKADLSIRQLFFIHNYGAKVQIGNEIIQIPPRPVFLLSYERLMNRIKGDKRLGKNVKRAIVEYINNANVVYADEYLKRYYAGENEG